MAYGLLGNCKPSAIQTETLIYTAPLNKKAVGTVVIANTSTDSRATVIITSGSVSGGLFNIATGGVVGTSVLIYNVFLRDTSSNFYEMPVVLAGITLGPGHSLVAYNNLGTQIQYSFNGIEEDV